MLCRTDLFKKNLFRESQFPKFLWLYPSTKMAVSPMFFEQIEKFQCLKLSTTQGPAHGTLSRHVARVTCPETCLKVFQLLGQKSPKDGLIWFDWQWGLLICPLGLLKTYVTSLGEFSKLIEACGEVCAMGKVYLFQSGLDTIEYKYSMAEINRNGQALW